MAAGKTRCGPRRILSQTAGRAVALALVASLLSAACSLGGSNAHPTATPAASAVATQPTVPGQTTAEPQASKPAAATRTTAEASTPAVQASDTATEPPAASSAT